MTIWQRFIFCNFDSQDLDYNCKLIPKSKPTLQKNSSENFEFKKNSQSATILAVLHMHFHGAPENW